MLRAEVCEGPARGESGNRRGGMNGINTRRHAFNTEVSWRAGVGAGWDCLAWRHGQYADSDGVRFSRHVRVSGRETACLNNQIIEH